MVNAKSYVKTNMGQSTTDIRPSQAEHCTTVEAKACPMDGSGTIPPFQFSPGQFPTIFSCPKSYLTLSMKEFVQDGELSRVE